MGRPCFTRMTRPQDTITYSVKLQWKVGQHGSKSTVKKESNKEIMAHKQISVCCVGRTKNTDVKFRCFLEVNICCANEKRMILGEHHFIFLLLIFSEQLFQISFWTCKSQPSNWFPIILQYLISRDKWSSLTKKPQMALHPTASRRRPIESRDWSQIEYHLYSPHINLRFFETMHGDWCREIRCEKRVPFSLSTINCILSLFRAFSVS